MRQISRIITGGLVITILLVCSSWGFLVHRTINQLAVYELPKQLQPFFYKNMEYLVANAPRPDTRRNTDSLEATKHFIDLEKFGENAAYSMPMDWQKAQAIYTRDSLLLYGYLPYHIVYIKERMTEAFRNNNTDSILFYAADIGHYIGDANVPLHTTENYDGQLTGQKGIHSLWESMIPELQLTQYNLSSGHKASYLKKPADAIWKAIRRSYALLPDMLAKEVEVTKQFTPQTKYRTQMRRGKEVKSYTTEFAQAYNKALGTTIHDQLIYSANLITDFWYTAWVDAGKPTLSVQFNKEQKAVFSKEKKLFKSNQLIERKLLISKKDSDQPAVKE